METQGHKSTASLFPEGRAECESDRRRRGCSVALLLDGLTVKVEGTGSLCVECMWITLLGDVCSAKRNENVSSFVEV